ncbi:MAG: hypothetical protein FJ144_16915 [Deltaproteobacteria bacterium]|nr:hypothetical protein [Deltaproteobacteria bacterium]
MSRASGAPSFQKSASFAAIGAIALIVAACGGGGGSSSSLTPPTVDPADPPDPECESFDGTFEAIQSVVFEKHGCTQDVCHGDGRQGGLDLREGAAYANLIEAPSLGAPTARVVPGSPDRSYLYRKLAASTRPGSFEITGSSMPSGLPALGEDELEAIRLWIKAGAPETGSVGHPDTGKADDVADLLDACLPPAGPITIRPLEPPAPEEGVQLVMPEYDLPAGKEVELCFASYYDFTGQVPEEYLSEDGTKIRYFAQEMRQDPQSHHLVLDVSGVEIEDIHHPSYGAWTCKGGDLDGSPCEPTDLGSCTGGGICGAEPKPLTGCIGYGPSSHFLTMGTQGLGGGQTTQLYEQFTDGVYNEMPIRGIWYWNSHAFNLSPSGHGMNARINFYFARNQQFRVERIPVDVNALYAAAGIAPFTTETVCRDWVIPQDGNLIELTSHMHKRGKHFTVELADGTQVYESLLYSDPLYRKFEPPMLFSSSDPADRTLHYCGLFNNGVAEDGSPDPETVTRASRMPDRASCKPIACAEGRIGEPCDGVDDDATCDTSPGAGDGSCDACAITAGVTTENEMFLMLGWYYRENPPAP